MKDILTAPPSRADLGRFAKVTKGGARAMVTTMTEKPAYQEQIAGKTLTDDQLLDVLAKFPDLLKKPLLTDGTRVLQGSDKPEELAAFVR